MKDLRYIETDAEPFAKYLDIMDDIDQNIRSVQKPASGLWTFRDARLRHDVAGVV